MKCMFCGGDLELSPNGNAAVCTSCRTVLPLPAIRPVFPEREEPEERTIPMSGPAAVPAEGASVSALLRQGYEALSLRDWRGAAAVFRSALEQDPDCAEAHFGRALARQSSESVDALIRKRQRGGTLVRSTLTACEEDRDRIAAAEKEYSVPGYYTPRQVRVLFEGFDRTYLSVTKAWRERLRDEYRFWETDVPMTEALRCARGDLALTLRSARDSILDELRRELELSENRDRERVQRIAAAYDDYLTRAEQEAARHRKFAERARDGDYMEACRMQEFSENEEDLLDAAGRFTALGAYLDSAERARQCREKIRRLASAQRERALAEELREQRRETERQAEVRATRRKRKMKIALMVSAAIAVPSITAAVLFFVPGLLPDSVKHNTGQALRQTWESVISFFRPKGTR